MLPYSEASERNKDPILEVLKQHLQQTKKVLEIGSGTAQHAVYFGKNLPHLIWQPSDQHQYLADIEARLEQEASENVLPPALLDVAQEDWQLKDFDAIFSANTLHIMSWQHVEHFFQGVGKVLALNGKLLVYGPFKYSGEFTTESNADFDLWLKRRDEVSGIRDFEKVNQLAEQQGLKLLEDLAMPANNQCLIWQKVMGSNT